jgi:FlaA1/EpsC-like NDP-sugar epimerase
MGNKMPGMNGYKSAPGLLFGFLDSLLIMLGILLGAYLRFSEIDSFIYETRFLVLKVMLIVSVIQIAFYYFDLYDLRIFREKKKMGILILESLGASAIFLALIYYLIPVLYIGRGIFAISLFFILIFAFLGRLFYTWALKAWTLKERVLIIGTGELAKKINKEIREDGYDGFEIVGFIDESGEKVGNRP